MLEVRYQNDLADVRSIVRVCSWRRRLAWSLGWFGIVVACALPPTLLFVVLSLWPALAGGWLLLGVLVAVIKYRSWVQQRAATRELVSRLRPTITRIGPQGFTSQSERGRSRCDWSAFERVVDTPQRIFLVTTVNTVHVIPKRAFASPPEAEQFVRAATDYLRSAGETASPSAHSAPPPPAGGDTLQIIYRNLPADFDSVQFGGLKKKNQPPPKQVTWQLGLATTGGGIVLTWSAARGDLFHQATLGSLAFLLLALASFLSIQRQMRRLAWRDNQKLCQHERTVTISPEGIAQAQPSWDVFNLWEEFSSVEDDDRFIVVFEQNRSRIAHLIPKRAFAATEDAERFVEVAKRHFERVHPPAINAQTPNETGNPYQAPLAG